MRKCYQHQFGGQDATQWAASWESIDLNAALRFARETSYVTGELRKNLSGQRSLEGGCGPAFYVKAYDSISERIIGADFSFEVLRRAKREWPELNLVCADVMELPFADGAFGAYYSGGVVEHFEEGPHAALREILRVLTPGGVLVITVPHVNLLRGLRDIARLPQSAGFSLGPGMRAEVRREFVVGPERDGWRFHEYAFTAREFRTVLESAGFEVESIRGCSILVGLKALIPRVRDRGSPTGDSSRRNDVAASTPGSVTVPGWKQIARRLLLSEVARNSVERWAIRGLGKLAGHMLVAIAKKKS